MSKGTYYFIITLGVLGALSSVYLFFFTEDETFGNFALNFFSGITLAGVGYMNLKSSNKSN